MLRCIHVHKFIMTSDDMNNIYKSRMVLHFSHHSNSFCSQRYFELCAVLKDRGGVVGIQRLTGGALYLAVLCPT